MVEPRNENTYRHRKTTAYLHILDWRMEEHKLADRCSEFTKQRISLEQKFLSPRNMKQVNIEKVKKEIGGKRPNSVRITLPRCTRYDLKRSHNCCIFKESQRATGNDNPFLVHSIFFEQLMFLVRRHSL